MAYRDGRPHASGYAFTGYLVTNERGEHVATWPNAVDPARTGCRVDRSKGVHQHRCSRAHAETVDGYRSWVAHEEATAEAATHGYPTELADYWRDRGGRPNFRTYLLDMRSTSD